MEDVLWNFMLRKLVRSKCLHFESLTGHRRHIMLFVLYFPSVFYVLVHEKRPLKVKKLLSPTEDTVPEVSDSPPQWPRLTNHYIQARSEANWKLITRQRQPETFWTMLAQACVSWPIRTKYLGGRGLKEGEYRAAAPACKPVLVVTQNNHTCLLVAVRCTNIVKVSFSQKKMCDD